MYKNDRYSEVPFSDIEIQLLNGYIYTEKVFLTGAEPMAIGFDKMKQLNKQRNLMKQEYHLILLLCMV